jgi:hypothetical protein
MWTLYTWTILSIRKSVRVVKAGICHAHSMDTAIHELCTLWVRRSQPAAALYQQLHHINSYTTPESTIPFVIMQ